MEIPRHWRLKDQRLRLVGNRCEYCGKTEFPPKPIHEHQEVVIFSSSKLPLYTLNNYMEVPKTQLRMQEL